MKPINEMTDAEFAAYLASLPPGSVIEYKDDGPLWSDVFGTAPIRTHWFCENAEQFAKVRKGDRVFPCYNAETAGFGHPDVPAKKGRLRFVQSVHADGKVICVWDRSRAGYWLKRTDYVRSWVRVR